MVLAKLFSKAKKIGGSIFHGFKKGYGAGKKLFHKFDAIYSKAKEVAPHIEKHYGDLFSRGVELLADAEKKGKDVKELIQKADPRQFKSQIEAIARAEKGKTNRPPEVVEEEERMVAMEPARARATM
jgi:hypothetical protein